MFKSRNLNRAELAVIRSLIKKTFLFVGTLSKDELALLADIVSWRIGKKIEVQDVEEEI